MNRLVPASAPKIDVQETREQQSSLGCLCGEGRSSLSASWSSRLTEAKPLQGRRLTTLLGHRSTERLTLWHHRPPGDSPEWQGPFLSSGVLRSWQRTKNIPIFGKCLLSTIDAPDTARNGGCDSEDRRHSGLNALSESPGPGVLTGFLEARPALPKPETLRLC